MIEQKKNLYKGVFTRIAHKKCGRDGGAQGGTAERNRLFTYI